MEKITFGRSKSRRLQSVQIGLTLCGFLAIALDHVIQEFRLPTLWPQFFCAAGLWLAATLRCSEELILDFDRRVYLYEKGIFPGAGFTGGFLTDIDHVYLGQTVDTEGRVRYISELLFRPDLQREPIRFRVFSDLLSAAQFETQMTRLLETATRLDVPVHDESGWRGSWRTPSTKPERYIILPGEPHPSTLLPPPAKW